MELSLEEKKAIEYLKKHIMPYGNKKGNIEFLINDVLLNLIEKKQKEIEALEIIHNTYKDKIRRIIKDLEEFDTNFFDINTLKMATKNTLQELLEEK